MIFRFDDICLNTDMRNAAQLAEHLKRTTGFNIWFCVSPLCHDVRDESGTKNQQVTPSVFDALSNFRNFYKPNMCGLPHVPRNVEVASHGLVHVDHRLLEYEAQELSILASCHILGTNTFVPPFNKWNALTEEICEDNEIQLIKFEDGWLSMEHNSFKRKHRLWYLHPRHWTPATLEKWLGQ